MTIDLDRYASKAEARIVRKLVNLALAHDLVLSVHDGEEWTVKASGDAKEVLAALASTGGDTLRLRDRETHRPMGSFFLIYQGEGDEGLEVVNDYSDTVTCQAIYAALEGED